ncbi:substrate-binding domain-containing protein [Diplocloster agilis]|uniref:sugar ABC transporter substrate-binding protein n=1 Tax=Diplocloster agilis TaxID=2850323 RepID=UPI0008222870|nr:substrate-binding domain-containing protein [Suonthocola fibrivorans]MCU6733551.1 substrate-binding domain-containing protein [Suonthocola fibrivorans]SCI98135.1 D-xylose-binding periplasmic protein precursor [uncultured Clostridium sp.]
MKRNFKTLIAACMAGTMILLLAACGGEKGQEPVAAPEESTAAPVQDAEKPEESSKDETAGDKYKIGVCFPTSMNEFWQYDVKMMNEVAEEHSDVEILLQVADDDADTQFSQVENLITQGIDALIICPVDTAAIGPALDACHEQGIYVVSLRRIAQDCWIDAISLFDQYQKGYQSAAAAFEAAPKGNYVLLNGDISSLPDVEEFKAAWYDVLQDAIDAGDVNVVLEQYCTSWSSDQGLMHTENALSLTNNKIDAIICANDDIAAGAISALEQAGLAGDVIITGADANLSALKYIMDGKQYSTIWQDSKSQHEQCVDLALKLMKGEALGDSDTSYNNGKMDIPAYKLEIDFIKNKEDMQESVIADGRYTDSEVFGE